MARRDGAESVPAVTIINKAPAAAAAHDALPPEATPSAPPPVRAVPSASEPAPHAAPAGTEAGTQAPQTGESATPPPPPLPPTLSIDIDLSRQLMTVAEDGARRHTWQISSARYGFRTPTGTFQPTWMAKMWYSRQYDLAPMPHAIFFHKGVAIHGTYATRALGNPASHGCVRLGLAEASALYKLVTRHGIERTRIVVHGAPDHSTAGRITRLERRAAPEEVVRFRRASPYRYLPPSSYGRGVAADIGAVRRAYGAPRNGPRGTARGYSYGYGF
jgi:lipoprotein-anchoring transpeptidase ErfK/SrfK